MERRKVVIITQYEMPDWKRNMKGYQRICRGSEHAKISLIGRNEAIVSDEIRNRVRVIRNSVQNRFIFLIYSTITVIRLKFEGYKYIFTHCCPKPGNETSINGGAGVFPKESWSHFTKSR